MKHYRSSIPTAAQERIVSNYQSTGNKRNVECVFGSEVVGYRGFSEEGWLATENPYRNGLLHGTQYYLEPDSNGRVRPTFAMPYRNGLPHGTAQQWDENGRLIGTFTMKQGTGWDLWRHRCNFGRDENCYLSEARQYKAGKWHGFEWWLEEDQKSVYQETHFWENLQHGIRREWNSKGRLKRGYPQYWIKNERVSKRQYLRVQIVDSNLPPFQEIDNLPKRNFPREVRDAIKQTARL